MHMLMPVDETGLRPSIMKRLGWLVISDLSAAGSSRCITRSAKVSAASRNCLRAS